LVSDPCRDERISRCENAKRKPTTHEHELAATWYRHLPSSMDPSL
jgi:hypothetical protein